MTSAEVSPVEKWKKRLATMKENRAAEWEHMPDSDMMALDREISLVAELIRDFTLTPTYNRNQLRDALIKFRNSFTPFLTEEWKKGKRPAREIFQEWFDLTYPSNEG